MNSYIRYREEQKQRGEEKREESEEEEEDDEDDYDALHTLHDILEDSVSMEEEPETDGFLRVATHPRGT